MKKKLEQKEETAILKMENRLKQKNLIMYQVGDKTPGRKALFSSDLTTQRFDCLSSLRNIVRKLFLGEEPGKPAKSSEIGREEWKERGEGDGDGEREHMSGTIWGEC